jgi:murein DD-endopeptidase MepM/ murein hydrolase activator NlpD
MSSFLKKLSIFLLLLILTTTVIAQEATPTGITIHVVQRDETLSEIALRYGTTIEAIVTANSLLNPNNLQVGQRLVIPSNANVNDPGIIITHIIQPGETLQMIAARYNSTLESLARLNNVTSSTALYLGQEIIVKQGAAGTLPPEELSLHTVQPDETLLQLAIRYQLPLDELATVNGLSSRDPLQDGQQLIIPNSSSAGAFVSFPAPIQDFQLSPLPAVQGKSIGATLALDGDYAIVLRVFEREVAFTPVDGQYLAVVGIHAFTEPGIYPLSVILTDNISGETMQYDLRLMVESGGYGSEEINVGAELAGLLDPDLVQTELDRVSNVMSGFTAQPYFSGLMNLPSTGRVTSQYGTRRSYNGSGFNTFHGGADFGGLPGAIITAPADGVVVMAEALNVRGNTVIIDHGLGVYTGYWHQTEIFVVTGQTVRRGDVIGSVGATGLVTGAHLHWEMWVSGVQVDPLQWTTHPFRTPPEVES